MYIQVLNRVEDFSDIFNKKCTKLGACVISSQEFKKFVEGGKDGVKPDLIIWSEGDNQVLMAAEKFTIPIVNLQWLQE